MQESKNRQPRALEQSMALRASAAHSSSFSSTSKSKECSFCGMNGHTPDGCFKMRDFSRQAKEEVKERQAKRSGGRGRKGKGKATANSAEETGGTAGTGPQSAEFAGNASTSDYTNPHSPLISDAGADWNTDTGATCHMTPHRHWFNTYTPHKTPIRLANN